MIWGFPPKYLNTFRWLILSCFNNSIQKEAHVQPQIKLIKHGHEFSISGIKGLMYVGQSMCWYS